MYMNPPAIAAFLLPPLLSLTLNIRYDVNPITSEVNRRTMNTEFPNSSLSKAMIRNMPAGLTSIVSTYSNFPLSSSCAITRYVDSS